MLSEHYFKKIEELLEDAKKQIPKINEIASIIADTIENDGALYVFGSSHAGIMAQELFYRAGGLMLVNPIFAPDLMLNVKPVTMTSDMEKLPGYGNIILKNSGITPKDIIIIISVSGRNAVPIDVAIEAKNMGIKVIVLTSLPYTNSVSSRHPSGKKLIDFADYVLDLGGEIGDAVLEVDGIPQKVGPTSSVVGITILNSLIAQVIEELSKRGITPPVFISVNLDRGAILNEELLRKYKDRIRYL